MQDLDKATVWRVGMEHRRVLRRQQEDLEISVEDDLKGKLHSGQTAGAQEVEGLETMSPRGERAPKVQLASSYLVQNLSEKGPRSAHNVVEKDLFQAETENMGV